MLKRVKNKTFSITYSKYSNGVHIHTLRIEEQFRNRGIATKIINNLYMKFGSVSLECWITLVPFYEKMGFIDMGVDEHDYYEMIKN